MSLLGKATRSSQPSKNDGAAQPAHEPSHPAEFLRIYCGDATSKTAFDRLTKRNLNGRMKSHHAKFMRATELRPFVTSVPIRNPSTSQIEGYKRSSKELFDGFWSIGWHLLGFPDVTRVVFGREDPANPRHRVDVVLAEPRSEAYPLIKPRHFELRMHKKSGVWFILAHAPTQVDGVLLKAGRGLCLVRRMTMLCVNGLVFTFKFTVTNKEQEQRYLKYRNEVLKMASRPIPDTKISGIPFDSDSLLDIVVFGGVGLGSGTFGLVFEGLNPVDGDLRVIKRIAVKNSMNKSEIQREIKALQDLQGARGITKLFGVRNNRGWEGFLSSYPSDIYLIQEKGIPFTNLPPMTWKDKECVTFDLLSGLDAVHDKGWMHRDINPQNLLFFPGNPPRATLNDFGKVSFEPVSNYSYIAAVIYLPPEIEAEEQWPYSQTIDVWMLGRALAQCFYGFTHVNTRDQTEWHKMIESLWEDENSFISSLLDRMLAWGTNDRPKTKALLADSAFRPFILNRGTKRKAAERDEGQPDGKALKHVQEEPSLMAQDENAQAAQAQKTVQEPKLAKAGEIAPTPMGPPAWTPPDYALNPDPSHSPYSDIAGARLTEMTPVMAQATHPGDRADEVSQHLSQIDLSGLRDTPWARVVAQPQTVQKLKEEVANEQTLEYADEWSTQAVAPAEEMAGATVINAIKAMPQGCSLLKGERVRPHRPEDDD